MHQMALRQLATADEKPYSWFSQLNTIAQKYQIDLHLALVHPWPKEAWKRYSKNTVRDIWWNELLTKACEKTTLRWTIWQDQQCTNGLWSSCKGRPHLTNAATTRARMLVDRSDLRASAWRRAAGEDLRCPLCRDPKPCAQNSQIQEERDYSQSKAYIPKKTYLNQLPHKRLHAQS